ncbi:membrane protein [Propionigenium maris DSM 9537]|uniref:Membrane protein n=1 Tax=Propionigenium maris DSM 9537 TaxID=1123000 RepID=A0A9W6GKV4_9FUSO|nr:MipA/OmpV family protein [Propionigenium maris]GLI56203.1 membrane protein [Propionigenium maris DSM 9537]
MNKKILAIGVGALLSAGVYAQDFNATLGLGAAAVTSPYQGVGTVGTPLPFINLTYGDFYLKTGDVNYSLLSIGYNFWKDDTWTLSAYVNPLGGFDVDRSEMDDGYNNLDRREYQFEGGLKAVAKTGWHDMRVQFHGTYGEEGGHLGTAVFRPFEVNDKLTLTPRVSLTYFESDYVDYYFGVSQSEANRNSKIDKKYSPDGAYSAAFDLGASYALRDHITLTGFAGVEKLSSEIDDSPIVEEDVLYRVGVGFAYKF